jgi:putative flippase GtrA
MRDNGRDSMNVLIRFAALSLSSAVVDNLVFFLVFRATGSIAAAQTIARCFSLTFNYLLARRTVFLCDDAHHTLLPRYLTLAALNAIVAYIGIRALTAYTPLSVMYSKIVAETSLFAANFLVQRAYIFARGSHAHS